MTEGQFTTKSQLTTGGQAPRATRSAIRRVARWMPLVATLVITSTVIAAATGWSWLVLGLGALAAVTWPLIDADLTEHRLPNKIVLPCYPIALASILLHSFTTGESPAAAFIVAGACVAGFVLMHVLGGMGMGDVKLVGVLGLMLGSLGMTAVVVGLSAAFLLGAVAGAWAMATQHRAATHRIPFGPFLLVGFWLGVLAPAVRAG